MNITEAIKQTRELSEIYDIPDQSKEALTQVIRIAERHIAKNAGKRYSHDELRKLNKWAAQEKPFIYIADQLNRTEGGIISKLMSIDKVIYIEDKPQYLTSYRRSILAFPGTN